MSWRLSKTRDMEYFISEISLSQKVNHTNLEAAKVDHSQSDFLRSNV